jgi:nitrite reductase (NADH) small subunit
VEDGVRVMPSKTFGAALGSRVNRFWREEADQVTGHRVGEVDDVRRAGACVVEVHGRPVVVLSVGDRFYAVHDRCPHMGAPMSAGSVGGTFVASCPHDLVYGRHDGVLRCPWHGWEFDLDTGRSLLEPARVGLRTYEVTVEDGDVVVHDGTGPQDRPAPGAAVAGHGPGIVGS